MKTAYIYTITDTHTHKTVSSPDWQEAIATARTWFPDAPEEVIEQLNKLEADPNWPHGPVSLKHSLGLIVKYTPADERQPTQRNTRVQHEEPEVVQMNARVSAALKERVRIYIAVHNITYQEFFEEALTDFLDRQDR